MYFRKEPTTLIPLMLYITFVAANAANKTEITCNNCLQVDGKCHTITHLLDFTSTFRKTVVITQMGILNKPNTLYYAFEPDISDPEYSKVGYANLISSDSQGILAADTSSPNLRTFYIDQDKEAIYFGGSNGISISKHGGPATYFSSMRDTIKSIFFKRKLFFVRDGENILVEKNEDTFNPYEIYSNIKTFVIDKNDNIIYLNTTGLYANNIFKNNTNDALYLSKNAFFRGLTTDKNEDVVYAWWIDGIYKVVLEDAKVVKVADIPNIGAITFDKNNDILFSSERGLYKLVQNNATVC